MTGKWLADLALRIVSSHDRPPLKVGWQVAFLSAYLGTLSHLALDSLVHSDMHPFSPWSDAQPWLGHVSPGTVDNWCVIAGLVGNVVYLAGLVVRRRISLPS